jgi:hypothetical protein
MVLTYSALVHNRAAFATICVFLCVHTHQLKMDPLTEEMEIDARERELELEEEEEELDQAGQKRSIKKWTEEEVRAHTQTPTHPTYSSHIFKLYTIHMPVCGRCRAAVLQEKPI